jgi:hypothetical protein
MQVLGSTVLLLLAFGWALAARNHGTGQTRLSSDVYRWAGRSSQHSSPKTCSHLVPIARALCSTMSHSQTCIAAQQPLLAEHDDSDERREQLLEL